MIFVSVSLVPFQILPCDQIINASLDLLEIRLEHPLQLLIDLQYQLHATCIQLHLWYRMGYVLICFIHFEQQAHTAPYYSGCALEISKQHTSTMTLFADVHSPHISLPVLSLDFPKKVITYSTLNQNPCMIVHK